MSSLPNRWFEHVAWILIVALSAVTFVIGGLSIWFVTDDPFPYAARVLISTFALGMVLLGSAVAATAFRRGERWAWLALWTYPAFFLLHVALLGTWVPDAFLAVVAALPLALMGPRTFRGPRAA